MNFSNIFEPDRRASSSKLFDALTLKNQQATLFLRECRVQSFNCVILLNAMDWLLVIVVFPCNLHLLLMSPLVALTHSVHV